MRGQTVCELFARCCIVRLIHTWLRKSSFGLACGCCSSSCSAKHKIVHDELVATEEEGPAPFDLVEQRKASATT